MNKILETNDMKLGIKLTQNNIGFTDNKITFPYFLTFLLKRFFDETEYIKW